jgi:hypothetical protein
MSNAWASQMCSGCIWDGVLNVRSVQAVCHDLDSVPKEVIRIVADRVFFRWSNLAKMQPVAEKAEDVHFLLREVPVLLCGFFETTCERHLKGSRRVADDVPVNLELFTVLAGTDFDRHQVVVEVLVSHWGRHVG